MHLARRHGRVGGDVEGGVCWGDMCGRVIPCGGRKGGGGGSTEGIVKGGSGEWGVDCGDEGERRGGMRWCVGVVRRCFEGVGGEDGELRGRLEMYYRRVLCEEAWLVECDVEKRRRFRKMLMESEKDGSVRVLSGWIFCVMLVLIACFARFIVRERKGTPDLALRKKLKRS